MLHRWSIAASRRLAPALCLAIATGWLAASDGARAAGFLSNDTPKSQERPTYAVPAARKDVDGDGVEALEAALFNASLAVQETRQDLETSRYHYTRARTRGYPRGDALLELQERIEKLEKEKKEVESNFLAAYANARAGGVSAGVLSDYFDLEEEISSAQ